MSGGISKGLTLSLLAQKASKVELSSTVNSKIQRQFNKNSEVCLIIEAGQSNAESVADIGTALPTMSNVFGLARAANLSTSLTDVTWSTFSNGDSYSLGRLYGSGKTSIVTEFARKWQEHITAGNTLDLPDLYVVRVPYSGNSIGEVGGTTESRWNVLNATTGSLTVEDLAYFTQYVVEIAVNNLVRSGKSVRLLGNVWVQGEQDSKNSTDATRYQRECAVLLGMLDQAAGCVIPTTFVKLRSNDDKDVGRFLYAAPINTAFEQLATDRGNGSWVLDPYNFSGAVPAPASNKTTQGTLYQADAVHYTTAAVSEFGRMLFNRVTSDSYRGPAAVPTLKTAAMNFFDKQGVAAIKATSDAAKVTADAAVGTAAIKASNFLANSSAAVVLPAITQIDVSTGTTQVLSAIRDATDKKKYFSLPNWSPNGKFKFLQMNGFKTDTLFGGVVVGFRGNSTFGTLLRVVPNATPANTFQSTGLNYLYVGVATNSTELHYTNAFTAGSGAGTASAAADGTSSLANTPKVFVLAFDSLAATASFRVLTTATINTTTHPNFGTAGASSEMEMRYALANESTNGTIKVEYRAIGAATWVTLFSWAIPASNTLGTELLSGGVCGFAFGVGNRGSTTLHAAIRLSSIAPVVLE